MFIGYGSADPHAAPGHVPGRGSTGPGTAAEWRLVEGCTDASSRTTVGPATVIEWTACQGSGRVALVRWDGLTHRWPGAGVAGEVQEIPGQGRVVYVRDPDGTLVGLRGQ